MRLLRSTFVIGGYTLVSRILGFVREMLLAGVLGAGPVADIFLLAFRFPNLFRRVFAEGAFNAAFVPLYSRRIAAEGQEAADRFDRAARAPKDTFPREGAHAAGLRRVARQLVRQRRMLGVPGEPGPAALALAVALAALLREVSAWQRDRGRGHQADAALAAADTLRMATAATTPPIDGMVISAPAARPSTTSGPHDGPRRDHAASRRF